MIIPGRIWVAGIAMSKSFLLELAGLDSESCLLPVGSSDTDSSAPGSGKAATTNVKFYRNPGLIRIPGTWEESGDLVIGSSGDLKNSRSEGPMIRWPDGR
jgi:hypothetical protein